MYTLKTKVSFDSAHFLPNYIGKCRDVHGHTWTAEIEIKSDELDNGGMVMDFSAAKKLVRSLDHKLLNDVTGLDNPTAENIARWIHERLHVRGMKIAITIWESPNSCVRYEEE